MPGYLRIPDTDIKSGFVALSEDIEEIEKSIGDAIAQEVVDNEGEAFVLEGEEDCFLLSPVSTKVDQTNTNGESWKSIKDVYIKQIITPLKSSIKNIKLQLKNESTNIIPVSFEIKAPDLEDDDGDVLATYSLDILPLTNSVFSIPFELNHIASGDCELIVKRTNVTGVSILYDSTGSYNKSMKESVDGVTYNNLNYDLYFETEYADIYTYDVVGSTAIIGGEKVYNLDTHVTISPPSSYGDRIDIVIMDKDGLFQIIESDVSPKPVAPESVPFSCLPIAEMYVPMNAGSIDDIIVSQDDRLGKYRLRSVLERVRRLEKKLDWVSTYNSPKRIKYELSEENFFDADNSTNMTYDSLLNSYILASSESITSKYDLTNDSGINTQLTTKINHSLHTNLSNGVYGELKLAQTTTSISAGGSWKAVSPLTGLSTRTFEVWANNKDISGYMGAYSLCTAGYLEKFIIDIQKTKNVSRAKCVCFKVSGSGQRDATLIEESSYLTFKNGIPQNPDSTRPRDELTFTFSKSKWIQKGWYLFIIFVEPTKKSSPASITYWTWPDPLRGASKDDILARFWGWYPMKRAVVSSNNYRYGIALHTKYNGLHVTHQVITSVYKYQTSGTLVSSPVATEHGIANVAVDMNISLPENTYYKLEVSNNNGTSYSTMSANSLTFSSQTGQNFVWKLTLYTNNTGKTPIVKYDPNDGYAIKFTLGMVSGSVTAGELVTKVFDGVAIPQGLMNITTDEFSHWEYLRSYATGPKTKDEETTQQKSLLVDIEASEDGSIFNSIKTGLRLGDMYHGDVDYSDYEGTYEADEYNYYCDVDEEGGSNVVLIDDFSTAGASEQGANVTVTTDSAYGTTTNKVVIASGATVGKIYTKTITSTDFTPFKQIKWGIRLEAGALARGTFSAYLSDGTNIATYKLPYIKTGAFIYVVFNPLNYDSQTGTVDFTEITKFGLYMNTDTTCNLYLEDIKGLKTDDFPIYQRYVRLRFVITRDNAQIVSPSIRKVGCIEILT